MNAPLRIGIAGIGRMGQRHALHLAHRTLGAQLVAACSPVASELEWARDKLNVKHLYRDYRDLVAPPGLDAVFLVTPTRSAGLSWYARRPRTRWHASLLRGRWRTATKPCPRSSARGAA